MHNTKSVEVSEPVYVLKTEQGIHVSPRPPVFCKAHVATYSTIGGGGKRTQKEPARIALYNNQFDINAVDDARPFKSGTTAMRLAAADGVALREMQAQHEESVKAFQQKRREFLKDAIARARRVNVSDCVDATTAA